MIAVIFELEPHDARAGDYFDTAADLAPLLREVDGFISVERFQSVSAPGRFVSLSFWRDEAAVQQWRNLPPHRAAQRAGRAGIFRHYRLRVAQVLRDYSMDSREQVPDDSRQAHAADHHP